MRKKYKLTLIIIAILIIMVAFITFFILFNGKKEVEKINVVDSIDEYGYTLDDRDSKLMKETYEELKNILIKDEINYEEYAKTISKLFVIDLFTMNNKINKYDVGSTEYVYTENVDNFKLNVEDTIYKSIINNSNGKRKQELPCVSSVNIESITEEVFEMNENMVDAYVIKINWKYEKDLGYDDYATIKLIKEDNKLYVVEYIAGELEE